MPVGHIGVTEPVTQHCFDSDLIRLEISAQLGEPMPERV